MTALVTSYLFPVVCRVCRGLFTIYYIFSIPAVFRHFFHLKEVIIKYDTTDSATHSVQYTQLMVLLFVQNIEL